MTAWIIDDESYDLSNCADAFRRFIKNYPDPSFRRMVNSTFADYVERAYTNEPAAVRNRVVSSIFRSLEPGSSPMFNTWGGYELNNLTPLRFQFIVMPSKMSREWQDAFAHILGVNNMNQVFAGADNNTIYRYTSYERLPLWLHGDLAEYEKAYNCHYNDIGIHIDESEENNFRRLPSLFIPEQRFRYKDVYNQTYTDEYEDGYRAQLKTLIEKAKKYGVLYLDDFDYAIHYVDRQAKEENFDNFVKNLPADIDIFKAWSTLMATFGGNRVKCIGGYPIGCQIYSATNDNELISMLRRKLHTAKALKDEVEYVERFIDRLSK